MLHKKYVPWITRRGKIMKTIIQKAALATIGTLTAYFGLVASGHVPYGALIVIITIASTIIAVQVFDQMERKDTSAFSLVALVSLLLLLVSTVNLVFFVFYVLLVVLLVSLYQNVEMPYRKRFLVYLIQATIIGVPIYLHLHSV